MFILCCFLPSERWYFHESGRCGLQTFQFSSSTVRRRMTRRIPACIANIVGDTVGDIAGMEAALLGSFAETTCAAQVLIAHSDALETSWKARRFPVLLSLWNCGGNLEWRQTLPLRRKCCSRLAFSQRSPRHQSTMVCDVHTRMESFATVVLSSGTNMVLEIIARMTKM